MTLFLNAHTDRLAPGSFQQPVPIPASQPGEPDLVQVCFNKDWLPLILGSLFQLTLNTTWQATSQAELMDGLQKANDLILLFQLAKPGCATLDTGPEGMGGDEMCCCLRMQDGILQMLSCGVWTDVPGWSKSEIAPGQPGDGTPQPPSGGCQIYQGKITPTEPWLIPTPLNAGDTIQISNLIGAWSPTALTTIWDCPDGNLFFAGNCVNGTAGFDSGAPMPSAPLNGTIVFDGTNYYDVSLAANLDTPVTITILPGVTNSQGLVRCNFHGGIDPAGEVTFTAKVCNNAVSSWSHTLDFTLSNHGFQSAHRSGSPTIPLANWVAGVGWQSVYNPDVTSHFNELRIWRGSLASTLYSAAADIYSIAGVPIGENAFGPGGDLSLTPDINLTPLSVGTNVHAAGLASPTFTTTSIRLDVIELASGVSHTITLSSLTLSGTGVDPFAGE